MNVRNIDIVENKPRFDKDGNGYALIKKPSGETVEVKFREFLMTDEDVLLFKQERGRRRLAILARFRPTELAEEWANVIRPPSGVTGNLVAMDNIVRNARRNGVEKIELGYSLSTCQDTLKEKSRGGI